MGTVEQLTDAGLIPDGCLCSIACGRHTKTRISKSSRGVPSASTIHRIDPSDSIASPLPTSTEGKAGILHRSGGGSCLKVDT